ncbi:TetR/AcrR family transcriptional regulator [Parahaliea sp. F7430]|uniref:TetR/AcrR family transcriptional regulator n=1 Tax=Sediminihaliea albiluteola TaxID=2758564 RepID=A0A7W2TTQ1_9GAMM|nr:TetR/AcrR family transcriptional regulator [Sediminihaliea albiluteola]MBA6411822.1 TetR/AcrR family transcriptional regulator [Sediminihaliea albiluteola]
MKDISYAGNKSLSKGEKTAQALLDVAEQLFAERGFEGATLREVAAALGIQGPAIYKHFASKEALYTAVLERALSPMEQVLQRLMAKQADLQELAELPALMTELLAQHPHMPALFQQALNATDDSAAHQLMNDWLDRLFDGGLQALAGQKKILDQAEKRRVAMRLIAMFNLCSGYFLSQRVLSRLELGAVLDEQNLDEQKKMLAKIMRLFLLE